MPRIAGTKNYSRTSFIIEPHRLVQRYSLDARYFARCWLSPYASARWSPTAQARLAASPAGLRCFQLCLSRSFRARRRDIGHGHQVFAERSSPAYSSSSAPTDVAASTVVSREITKLRLFVNTVISVNYNCSPTDGAAPMFLSRWLMIAAHATLGRRSP